MRWVVEYLRCEQACRDLVGKLSKPDDKRALELMAAGWAARAAERIRKIDKEISFPGEAGADCVERQREIVERLKPAGRGDSTTAENAQALLQTMERAQQHHIANREQIKRLLAEQLAQDANSNAFPSRVFLWLSARDFGVLIERERRRDELVSEIASIKHANVKGPCLVSLTTGEDRKTASQFP